MSKQIELELVTPQKHMLTTEAESLVLPGSDGSFGVLPGHVPLVAALKPGMLKIKQGDQEEIYAIGGGYAEICMNKAIILADTAELAEDIDIEAARKERARAVEQLKAGVHGAELDQAEVSLKKALARLSVANVVRRKKGSSKK